MATVSVDDGTAPAVASWKIPASERWPGRFALSNTHMKMNGKKTEYDMGKKDNGAKRTIFQKIMCRMSLIFTCLL